MRDQRVTKVVDALVNQRRVIVWLACSHKISISATAWYEQNLEHRVTVGEVVQCPYCPDPPPEDVRREKTAQQLWNEAGQP